MFDRIVYASALIAALCCLALIPTIGAQRTQIGVSAQVASPEIIRQMKRQSVDGLTAYELREFDKLRAADQEIIRKLAVQARTQAERISALQTFVDTLDVSINTRLLTETVIAVRDLQKSRKDAEDLATEERKSNRETSVWILRTVVITLLGGIVTWWNRRAAESRKLKREALAHTELLEKMLEVRDENRTAIEVSNNVNEKLVNIGVQMRDGEPLCALRK